MPAGPLRPASHAGHPARAVAPCRTSLRHGAQGCCGTAANFCPEPFVWLCDHADTDEAAECQQWLSIADFLVRNQYPLSAKAFLAQQGLPIQPLCRTMAQTFTEEERTALAHLGEMTAAWKANIGSGCNL